MKQRLFTMLLLFAGCCPLVAEDHVFDLRHEINEEVDGTYQNFIYARTFAGGKLMFEGFHLRLPQEGYEESAAGVGYNALTLGDLSVYLVGHLATATDDEYFEPALFASDIDGKLTGSVFLLHYVPLGDDGLHQWLIDPIEIQYNVFGRVSLGGSGYFWKPKGGPWLIKIGPKLSLADKLGATELRIATVNGGDTEFQFRRIFVF